MDYILFVVRGAALDPCNISTEIIGVGRQLTALSLREGMGYWAYVVLEPFLDMTRLRLAKDIGSSAESHTCFQLLLAFISVLPCHLFCL